MVDVIKLLPDHVANQIAAGEVVQRPASVVKELLENAIDAGASVIKLIVKDGGKALIQVVDDGVGMSETDARLSFERHATSKISSAEDLFNLKTKGFRGEALASIAAIAHVDLQTRNATAEVGTQIKIEGSTVVSQEIAVTPKGTSISVKNLFFNIPARRNFLKSNQVELRHITDEFQRVALVHPSVAFRYYNNGSELFNLPSESFRQRIVHVFGSRINERLVPVEEETDIIKISGFISKPEFAKKSRGEQFFFANGRFIKSPYLHHAIVAAFDGLLKTDFHPGYFLNLEVNPASIDINIHPTKTEVKFDDENTLYAILRSTVKHSLGQFSVAPVLDFEHDRNLDTPYAYQNRGVVLPQVTVDNTFNPFAEVKTSNKRETPYTKQNVEGWENLYAGINSKDFSSVEFESEGNAPQIFESKDEGSQKQQITFQLKRKYVVATIKSGMVVIDQTRAHQRVLYEKFLQDITVKEAVSQQLLFPMELNFTKEETRLLLSIRESLSSLGFVLEIHDEQIKVTGIPSTMTESGIGMVLEELLKDFSEGYETEGFSQAELMAKTLCKSLAIRTGQLLEQDSQIALVNDLFGCKEPNLNPFQKMTFITLSSDDIDKKFN
ncbi:DNA mismatch repair endonuclease MutL [uncultured Croceitalea sp.]|uniref:DNA mismatch repair endonuclease MutL n=1 Tax=uncultured Croceitalea sp. TaxID=1798908 RepID=UPI00374EBE2E